MIISFKSVLIDIWEFLKANYTFIMLAAAIILLIYIIFNFFYFIKIMKETSNVICLQMENENELNMNNDHIEKYDSPEANDDRFS